MVLYKVLGVVIMWYCINYFIYCFLVLHNPVFDLVARIQATLVRVMKARKRLPHQILVSEVRL